jgi:hypothetical protein
MDWRRKLLVLTMRSLTELDPNAEQTRNSGILWFSGDYSGAANRQNGTNCTNRTFITVCGWSSTTAQTPRCMRPN